MLKRSALPFAALCLVASCSADPDATLDLASGNDMNAGALSTTCSADAIGNPPEFEWTYVANGNYYVGELEVSEATFTLGADTLTTRAYRQPGHPHSIPGPTIRMKPGSKYVLRFQNRLPYEPLSAEHNVFKDPNASNIHTHGLHISGESPGDDVTRTFEGGFGGDFVYDIPADHMGGTYWYHAHHHGSTFLQVSAGTFGLLIIDDSNDGLPPNVAAMQERNLVLGYLDPGVAGTGGDTLIRGTLSPTWTLNGRKTASLCIPANEWQHWRVLLADRDAKPKSVTIGPGCQVALMARDGVWRTQVPKALPSGSISLTGASRADFAVRCTANASITVGTAPLGTIIVEGTGNTSVNPYNTDGVSTWSAKRPTYLRNLASVPTNQLHTESVRMGARTVNGSKFDHATPTMTLNADKVQAWNVSGAAQHPFHLHVYHMQAFGCGGDYEDGEYYDTIASNCDVRFDLNASTSTVYAGRTVMHCHILEHEDQGAMGWAKVVGGRAAPTYPSDTPNPPWDDYYALSAAVCGDASCDTGETACNCPADCGAPPGTETTCTDGVDNDCDGDLDCIDTDCAAEPACAYCGDLTCGVGENACNCASDCGTPPTKETSCTDGLDEDCDGATDCADADCATNSACATACGNGLCNSGESCTTCPADCDGVVGGKPSSRFCCGDGTAQGPEGNGTICDGNF